MEKALHLVSENLHLDFSFASSTCTKWGKPHELLSITILFLAENEDAEL